MAAVTNRGRMLATWHCEQHAKEVSGSRRDLLAPFLDDWRLISPRPERTRLTADLCHGRGRYIGPRAADTFALRFPRAQLRSSSRGRA